MSEEKIKEVFSDEEFVKSLLALETPEEVQDALKEKDIDISTDEIKKIAEMIKKKVNGELSDDDLEAVAGGSVIGCIIIVSIFVAMGVGAAAKITNDLTEGRW